MHRKAHTTIMLPLSRTKVAKGIETADTTTLTRVPYHKHLRLRPQHTGSKWEMDVDHRVRRWPTKAARLTARAQQVQVPILHTANAQAVPAPVREDTRPELDRLVLTWLTELPERRVQDLTWRMLDTVAGLLVRDPMSPWEVVRQVQGPIRRWEVTHKIIHR